MEIVNKIQIGSDLYDIVDNEGRVKISNIENKVSVLETNTNNLLNIANNKNGIYRGKDLGTITVDNVENFFTTHEISNSKFTDLFLGDTFIIKDGTYNVRWVIAGFNTEYNKGDTALQKGHISVIPATHITTSYMNDTNTTVGGYKGSYMHTTKLPEITSNLENVLGNHILTHRCLVSNAVSADALGNGGVGWKGASSGWEWTDCKLTLMTEVQVYGATIFSSGGYDIGEGANKLPIFNFINHCQLGRYWFWLRSVASSTDFCNAGSYGLAYCYGASLVGNVRPLMLLG